MPALQVVCRSLSDIVRLFSAAPAKTRHMLSRLLVETTNLHVTIPSETLRELGRALEDMAIEFEEVGTGASVGLVWDVKGRGWGPARRPSPLEACSWHVVRRSCTKKSALCLARGNLSKTPLNTPTPTRTVGAVAPALPATSPETRSFSAGFGEGGDPACQTGQTRGYLLVERAQCQS